MLGHSNQQGGGVNLATRLSLRERGLFFLTSGIIAAALLVSLVLDPLASRWKKTAEALSSQTLRFEKYRRLLSQRERIEKRFSQVAAQVKMQGSQEEEMASFLSFLEQIAGKAGLPLKELRPRPVTSQGDFRVFLVEVSAEGKMDQMTRFLYELQTATSAIRVNRMQLAVKGGSLGETDAVEARLTLSTLHMPSPSQKK